MSPLVNFVVFCCHSVHISESNKPLHDDYFFTCSPRVVSPRKVSRFAPLNRYYIIIHEVFFDNFGVIIYLLVICKKNNNSFILVYFNYLFISCIQKNNNSFILVSGILTRGEQVIRAKRPGFVVELYSLLLLINKRYIIIFMLFGVWNFISQMWHQNNNSFILVSGILLNTKGRILFSKNNHREGAC
jgi:hypothetical protein